MGLTLLDFTMVFVEGTELQNQSKYNDNGNIIKHISVRPALQRKSKGLGRKKTNKQYYDLKAIQKTITLGSSVKLAR